MSAGSVGEALKISRTSSDTIGHTQWRRLMCIVSVAEVSARCQPLLITGGHTQ